MYFNNCHFQADISNAEIRKRAEYLKAQRDRILEKKKQDRESKLHEYQNEMKQSAPEPVKHNV